MNNILENNTLIAIFERRKFYGQDSNGDFVYKTLDKDLMDKDHKMQYHDEWNWLLPVVEKITNIKNVELRYCSDRNRLCIVVEMGHIIYDKLHNTMFEAYYNGTITFIKWNNKKKG